VLLWSVSPTFESLQEIAIGILGNMACTPSVCDSMADSLPLVSLSLCLLSNSDTPTLVETTRFLNTILSSEKCRKVWLAAWKEDPDPKTQIMFILRSSINSKHTALLLSWMVCNCKQSYTLKRESLSGVPCKKDLMFVTSEHI